jgi:cell division protein FtsQ
MSPSATGTQPRSTPPSPNPPSPDSPPPKPRLSLRRELQRHRSAHRRLVLGVVAALVVVLLGLVVWLVAASPVLATEEVAVTGAKELTTAQVREAAAVPLGKPLARQDVDAITRRVAALPQAASVTVERRWPHTLEVALVERQPLLAVRQPDGFALVAEGGVVYETKPEVPEGVLLTDANPTAIPLLTDLGVVATALPAELRDEVQRVRATAADDIVLELESGTTVRWGDARESVLKAQVVETLRTGKNQTIDVSAPHTPAVR